MKFFGFSADYVKRLTEGDPYVEEHFTAYFGELIFLKLRNRLRSPQLIEDIRQETLLRVVRALRTERGIDHPERLGAFVNAVSNNVLREMLRQEGRHEQMDPEADPANGRVDLDLPLINEERKRLVESVLAELPWRDRQILRLLYLEERTVPEICRELKVDNDYLRVLTHRAKTRFRNKLASAQRAGA